VIRVASGAVLVALAVVAVFFAPRLLFAAIGGVLVLLASLELAAIAGASGAAVAAWPAACAALATFAAFVGVNAVNTGAVPPDVVLLGALVVLGIVALGEWDGGSHAVASVAAGLLPSLYLALPIGALVAIRETRGPEALFLLMATVMVSDTAQYYVGRLAGRRPLAPAVSPKKTVEGAVGGLVFGTITMAAAGIWWLPRVGLGGRVVFGLAIAAVGIVGDLFESMLKRSARLKDSSHLIPGHGGVLDRIDALLFAAPVYYLVLRYL
jgi:phosphatidate cytidylyltransferase